MCCPRGPARLDPSPARSRFGWSDNRTIATLMIAADEPGAPTQLGKNSAPNPQVKLLMAALNACMLKVGYVTGAAIAGVRLSPKLGNRRTTGELDLRGFLNIDPRVKAGYAHAPLYRPY